MKHRAKTKHRWGPPIAAAVLVAGVGGGTAVLVGNPGHDGAQPAIGSSSAAAHAQMLSALKHRTRHPARKHRHQPKSSPSRTSASPRPTTPSPRPTTPSPHPTTPKPDPTTSSPGPTTPAPAPTSSSPAASPPGPQSLRPLAL